MKIDGIRRDSSNIAKKAWYAESRRRRFALFLLRQQRVTPLPRGPSPWQESPAERWAEPRRND